jgi:hypothetical protein
VPDLAELETAAVWTGQKYAGMRQGLVRRASAPREVPTGDAAVKVLDFPRRGAQGTPPPGPLARLLVYSSRCLGIPTDALASPIRLAIIVSPIDQDPNQQTRIHSHVLRVLRHAVVALFGEPGTVRGLAQEVQNVQQKEVVKTVDVWVRSVEPAGPQQERSRLQRRLLVLMGGANDLDITKVCVGVRLPTHCFSCRRVFRPFFVIRLVQRSVFTPPLGTFGL